MVTMSPVSISSLFAGRQSERRFLVDLEAHSVAEGRGRSRKSVRGIAARRGRSLSIRRSRRPSPGTTPLRVPGRIASRASLEGGEDVGVDLLQVVGNSGRRRNVSRHVEEVAACSGRRERCRGRSAPTARRVPDASPRECGDAGIASLREDRLVILDQPSAGDLRS